MCKLYLCTDTVISLYWGRFYARWAKNSSLYREYRYIEDRYIGVLSHTFYCNFSRDIAYLSLYRGYRISRIVVSGFHCSIDRPNLQVALERIEYITVDGKEVLYGPSDKMFFTTSLPFSCFGGFSSEILFFHCHYVPRIVHNKRKIPFISCLLSSRAENIYFISTTKKRYKKVNPECNIARAIKSG